PDSDERIDGLSLEVADRIAVSERRGRRRRAVHHDEPERGERERHEHEQLHLERSLLGARAHASSSTSRRNVSPRCSKSSNWSKLAAAGESSTTSPGSASAAACASACARSPSREYERPAASSAAASSAVASPTR